MSCWPGLGCVVDRLEDVGVGVAELELGFHAHGELVLQRSSEWRLQPPINAGCMHSNRAPLLPFETADIGETPLL